MSWKSIILLIDHIEFLSIFLGNFLLRCLWLWIKVRNSTKSSCRGKIDSERQWKFNEEYNQIFSIKKTIFLKLFSDLIYFLLKNPFLTDFLKIIGKQNSFQHIFLDCNFFLIIYLFIYLGSKAHQKSYSLQAAHLWQWTRGAILKIILEFLF